MKNNKTSNTIKVQRKPKECNFDNSFKNSVFNKIFNKVPQTNESNIMIRSNSIKSLSNNPIINTSKQTNDYAISGNSVIQFQNYNINRKGSGEVAAYRKNNYTKHYDSNRMKDIFTQSKSTKNNEDSNKITSINCFIGYNNISTSKDFNYPKERQLNTSRSVHSICFNEKNSARKIETAYDKISNQTIDISSRSKDINSGIKYNKFSQKHYYDSKIGCYFK
jgi:hypothetical protein